jgi:peptide/nickel transport system permease protein
LGELTMESFFRRWNRFKTILAPRIRELRFSLKRLRDSPLSMVGISIIAVFAVIALLAPILAKPNPRDAYSIPKFGFSPTPKPPSSEHIFGLTQDQYDIYYGVIWGTRTAFRVSILVVGSALLIGLVIGSIAGYYGGIVDEIFMRITDIFLAFPYIVLIMAFVVAMGASLDSVLRALIIVWWPSYARLIRAEVLSVREEDYVEAAKAVGGSDFRVITRHVIPNSIYPILVMASLDMGAVVLTAAAMSFLGLGAPVGYADWGQMISFSQNWIVGPPGHPFAYWYTVVIPGVFIFFFVLGWSLLGDAFRDILDPKLRRR